MDSADTVETVSIAGFHHSRLESGSKQRWSLTLIESLAGTLTTPLLTCRGVYPGAVVLAVAGIHGDEFEGMAAIRRVWAELDPRSMRGTFLAIPIANPWAYEAQTRESPASVDGKNLARVFPGREGGSATEILAARLFRFVLSNLGAADLLVDLHSGGTRYRYVPMVGYRAIDNAALEPSREAARHFGIDRLWIMPGTSGPLNAETARAGIPTIGAEVTGQGGCLPGDVTLYADGIRHCLRHKELLSDRRLSRVGAEARETLWLNVATHGVFTPRVELGSAVTAGHLLATVAGAYGDIHEELRAERDGEIWALRTFPSVRPDDIAFVMAHT